MPGLRHGEYLLVAVGLLERVPDAEQPVHLGLRVAGVRPGRVLHPGRGGGRRRQRRTARPWDYHTGHVAVVVKVNDSSSFTIAEYNWHANGGGFGIMDFRRVSMNVGAVSAFIR